LEENFIQRNNIISEDIDTVGKVLIEQKGVIKK
jgi:hypothetical protein